MPVVEEDESSSIEGFNYLYRVVAQERMPCGKIDRSTAQQGTKNFTSLL